eukprot:jgi/Botrbrau1/1435/Bobra.0063s0126.1
MPAGTTFRQAWTRAGDRLHLYTDFSTSLYPARKRWDTFYEKKVAHRHELCAATRFDRATGHLLSSLPPALQNFLQAAVQPSPGLSTGLMVNSTVFVLGITVLLRGLTLAGVGPCMAFGHINILCIWAWGISTGLLVTSSSGQRCLLLLCMVTKIKLEQKQKEGIAEARSGRRSPASVYGSGAAGMACAALALLTQDIQVWQIGFVASFVSKLSDTMSSEIGKAYGKTTYLITTMQRVPRGTEGAISAEGTAAGAFAAVAFGFFGISPPSG